VRRTGGELKSIFAVKGCHPQIQAHCALGISGDAARTLRDWDGCVQVVVESTACKPETIMRRRGGCYNSGKEKRMAAYETGDFVKEEFRNDQTAESDWMWVRVDSCDDAKRLVFGRLDTMPLLDYSGKLRLDSEIAVSFDNIREHRKPQDSADR
jgi:hypothetical protein